MKAGGILEWVHDLAPSFARTQPFVDASSRPFAYTISHNVSMKFNARL
jgi:hypothetical protein